MKQLILLSFFFLFFTRPVFSAYLYLSPKTQTVSKDEVLIIDLYINTEKDRATALDAFINFDEDILQYMKEETPPEKERFFTKVFSKKKKNQVYIAAGIAPGESAKSGEGKIVSIFFQPIKEGTVELSFKCTPGDPSDTNIADDSENAKDIINCQKTEGGRYIVENKSSGEITPSPTYVPSPTTPTGPTPIGRDGVTPTPSSILLPTVTPTPKKLPRAGDFEKSVKLVKLGVFLAISGVLIRIFSGL